MNAFAIRLRRMDSTVRGDAFESDFVAEEFVLKREPIQVLGNKSVTQPDRPVPIIQHERVSRGSVSDRELVHAAVIQTQIDGVLVALDRETINTSVEVVYRDPFAASERDKSSCFFTSSFAGSRPHTDRNARRTRSACGTGRGAE